MMAKFAKLQALMDGEPIPKDEPEEDKPKPIILELRKFAEGTRDNFSMYIYNTKSDSTNEERKILFQS